MTDIIELVIKIPEEYYKVIMKIPDNQSTADMLIIKNGTPLPKGHGRILDEKDILDIKHQDAFGETNGYHPRKAKPKDDGKYQQYEMNYGYFMMLDGWTNCYDQMPDQPGIYLVENHNGDRGKQEAVMSFDHMVWKTAKWNAYDTNWWKPLEISGNHRKGAGK